jgi:hypothetical protein
LNAARRQKRAQADAQRKRETLLGLVRQTAAEVVAPVGGVENDEEARRLRCGRRS